jgi:hypothetical protein
MSVRIAEEALLLQWLLRAVNGIVVGGWHCEGGCTRPVQPWNAKRVLAVFDR